MGTYSLTEALFQKVYCNTSEFLTMSKTTAVETTGTNSVVSYMNFTIIFSTTQYEIPLEIYQFLQMATK